jgi:hypothetical protein
MGRAARVALAAALLFSVFVALNTVPVDATGAAGPTKPPPLPSLPALDPASPSLSPGGRDELQRAALTDAPVTR